MSEYKVELVQCQITEINIHVDLEENTALQIESEFFASIFEPNDAADPTTMLKVECSFKDPTSKLLDVKCSAELVFSLDPIPEKRIEVLSGNTREAIQEELTKRVVAILKNMGHNFAFS